VLWKPYDSHRILDDFGRNVEAKTKQFDEIGVRRIVTPCAGCYRTLKLDYPKYGGRKIEVLHMPELLARGLEEGTVNFSNLFNVMLTYHDRCHIGRHVGIYEQPRRVLRNVSNLELVEMKSNREYARCCGAGGSVLSGFPEISRSLSRVRMIETKETRADILATTCPFCNLNFRESAPPGLKILDLT